MRHQIAANLDRAITTLLLVVVGLTPILFLNFTTEFYETPKLIFLVVSTLVLILLWSVSWIVKGKVSLTRTPLDIPLIILLVIILISTFFSGSRYVSIFGNLPRIHGSAISWVTYILFYFVAVSHLRTPSHVRSLVYVLLGSGVVVSLLSIMSFFGLYLPLPFSQFQNFTPTGSSFSTVALMILLLPLTFFSIIHPNRYMPQAAAAGISVLFAITILLLGNWTFYIVTLVLLGIALFVSKKSDILRAAPFLALLAGVSAILFVALITPIAGNRNPLQQKYANFPREVQMPFINSWKVSVSAFRDSPFLGTGPATYLFDFTQYKPLEHNQGRFWNINFDTAHNEFLQMLATLGILGVLAFLFLALIVVNFAWRNIFAPASADQNQWQSALALGLGLSSIAALVLLLIHSSTLVSIVITFVILAMLMAISKGIRGKVQDLSLGIRAQSIAEQGLIVGDALPFILFIPIAVLILYVFWNTFLIVRGDYHHRLALNAASQRGIDTYNNLVQAERLNPRVDLYRIDLAQTNFALANAIAAQKGPSESSPGGSLTDQDRRTIQQLLSQSINEGRAAVALSPNSSRNWEVLAAIYRQISGVAQNSLAFSLDAYGRAIQKDPLNPLLRLNVGGIYYAARNYDLAIRFFSDAANLKPDYANAYFNLSVALRDKGDLRNAQAAAEQVVRILQADTNSPDYKTASDYLSDLKARISTGSAQQAGGTAPAAQQTSPLQNDQLPDDLDAELGNTPQAATPAAVRPNPNNPIRTSPSPSPQQ
jgi:O-antigen ligase/Tfp pilus assembly protein PilF